MYMCICIYVCMRVYVYVCMYVCIQYVLPYVGGISQCIQCSGHVLDVLVKLSALCTLHLLLQYKHV